MAARAPDRTDLQHRLGYTFARPELLERALTHTSAISPGRRTEHSYQRLEFLGDRVLGLVIADLLHQRLPQANEGDLSRSLNALVRKETCAAVARDLSLGHDLELGDSEARTGGAEKDAILADACEAVIGAIYVDGGLDPASAFVERHFGGLFEQATNRRADAKTTLQEWAQARGLPPPNYDQVDRRGPDHAPMFTIAVSVGDFEPASASGASKKLAEHEAAERFLLRENVWERGE
jgi:ribonuclease-3